MSHLSATVRVDASPETVFDIVADPARAPEWQSLVAEMLEMSGRPGGLGTSYVARYRVAGRRLETRFVVTAAERPTLLAVAGTTRGGWVGWTTVIERAGDGSIVRASLEFELPGEIVGGLFGLLTGNRVEREFRRTYANLKGLAEAEADARDRAATGSTVAGLADSLGLSSAD
jgi:uncharacterized protein YndB with AHSA1/START domain